MDTLALHKKLITFRTTEDRIPEIKKAVAFVVSLLKKKKIYTKIEYLEGKPVLYACTKKTSKPDILLVPHLDVVEGEDEQFIPKVKGNRLIGRGAGDCKSNVTACLQALLAVAGSGKNVGLLLSTDEEIGGATTKMMVKKGYVGKVNLLLDSGRSITYRQKGILNLEVTVAGKAAHGAGVWMGDNANEKLMSVFAHVKKLFPPTTARNRWKRTVNLGIMQGGDVINKVPDSAWMRLNIRLTEKDDPKKLVQQIRKIRGMKKVTVLEHHPFYAADPKSPAVKAYKKSMEKSLRAKLPLESMHGATDAHNFASVKYPVIISGTGASRRVHSRYEYALISEVKKFEKALIEYIRSVT